MNIMKKRILISPNFIGYVDIVHIKNIVKKEYGDVEIEYICNDPIIDSDLSIIYFSTHILFASNIETMKNNENCYRYTSIGPFVVKVKPEKNSIIYFPDRVCLCLLRIESIIQTALDHKFIVNNIQ